MFLSNHATEPLLTNIRHLASYRLHGAMGVFNSCRFSPHANENRDPSNIMDPEFPILAADGQSPPPTPTGLRSCLESASRKNGYRSLKIESLKFQGFSIERKIASAEELTADPPKGPAGHMSGTLSDLMDLDSNIGNITMCETVM